MKQHKWVITMLYPITPEELAEIEAEQMIRIHSERFDERPHSINIYCIECRLPSDEVGSNCPGEPIGFAADGTPVHVDRN